jgi:hypothetical protein
MASASRVATMIFLSLTALAFASFATKRVSILSSVPLPTSILLLSPELNVGLSELERSSGERRGDQRGNQLLTLLFTVAVFRCGGS